MLVLDRKGHVVAANPVASRVTGFSHDRLLRIGIEDLAVQRCRLDVTSGFQDALEVGYSVWTATVNANAGQETQIEFRAFAFCTDHVAVTLRDTSQETMTERTLKQAVETYSSLVQLCHAAVISADADNRIVSWNPGAELMFGYSEAETMGQRVTLLIPQRLRRKHVARFKRRAKAALDESFSTSLETIAVRKDGTELAIEVNVAVGSRNEEKVFVAVMRDISEHREVVERLNDTLQRLRFHFERMPLAYIVWDADFEVTEWNPAAEKIFGYRKSEALGKTAYELIVPPDLKAAVDEIWSALLKGDLSSHSINANVRADGSRLTCEWFNTPLSDSQGRIHGVASMVMDLSEREALEAQLRNTQKLESLGVLASGVAHDFNSSLTVILGNTALVKSTENLPARVYQYLEAVEEAGFRAKDFIDHLLAYARTGRHKPQPTNLNAVVESALTFVRSSINKRHELKSRLAKQLPTILADHSQVEQVILNLCLNADQALHPAGELVISTRVVRLSSARASKCVPDIPKPGQYVELKVSDNGCGMDGETVQRIFDPFFTTKAEGHGLGLASVLGILRQHNAVAYVDSTVGTGTSMHIYFPVHRE
ncbi:MAG: PAS domain S-box protein [Planctomycetes bacterium]|nr:PAS domain S-box protein [Planctomycetota bacterium]